MEIIPNEFSKAMNVGYFGLRADIRAVYVSGGTPVVIQRVPGTPILKLYSLPRY